MLATAPTVDGVTAAQQAALRVKLRRDGGTNHAEWLRCHASPTHFISQYVQIYDATSSAWLPFTLWPAQEEILAELDHNRMVCILKARQLGMSWLVLGYALWLMLFKPAATVSIFSRRDDEAVELLDFRLKGMHDRLPSWLRLGAHTDGKHQWLLSNGSRAMAFPTTGGRSYTSTLAIIDEADFVKDLKGLMNAVQPTVDAGGQMVLLSTPDKAQPESLFKKIYLAARDNLNEYRAIFHGWRARPSRTQEWYEAQKRAIFAQTGALDDLHQEYPETDAEALAPNSLDKRFPPEWLLKCYRQIKPLVWAQGSQPEGMPSVAGLQVFIAPVKGTEYRIGADPAEGNPTSDESASCVVVKATGEEVAMLAGRWEPAVFASHTAALARWYNRAPILCERNNHGHSCILWWRDNAKDVTLLNSTTDNNPGWLTTSVSKTKMYDNTADNFREGDAIIHGFETYLQLSSVDGAKLEAPEGQHDDRATAYVLAHMARSLTVGSAVYSW